MSDDDDNLFDDADFLNDFDPDAAIRASQSQSQSQSSQSPFGPKSGLSIGTKTNPNDFVDHHRKRPLSGQDVVGGDGDGISPSKQAKMDIDSNSNSNSHMQKSLLESLDKYFGHKSFRNGQLSIIEAVTNNHPHHPPRDAAVFWSTGSGKSLCYQLPPLHTNQIGIVISPLISLMEDQVSKLNGLICNDSDSGSSSSGSGSRSNANTRTGRRNVAVFLGSGQTDPQAEQRALNGEYSLIYVTPEKLCGGSGYFLDALGAMHTSGDASKRICLIAVDESHCVSEWGHDFRKDYRNVGDRIRSHPIIGGHGGYGHGGVSTTIPILALTATAVPRVQKDIISSLRLHNPCIVKQSFDRDNLVISIKRKPTGGYRAALASFVKEMKKKRKPASAGSAARSFRRADESTIIYCPTKSSVEEVENWLSMEFESGADSSSSGSGSDVRVQAYHGGMSIGSRSDAHINYLTGKTSIIVATLAFGMGIDKSDTRRIIHYGPPKTVEEYYQQIGRAGRDGLEAHCVMYCNSGDFDKYKDDFYLGNLSPAARANQEASIDALRKFAISEEACRRAELLRFFEEEPHFGERCGTCDTCVSRAQNKDDIERDFADGGARLVLYAISVLNSSQGTSQLDKILKGNIVESYRYNDRYADPNAIKDQVLEMKSKLKGYKKRVPVTYFSKEILPALMTRDFVQTEACHHNVGGRRRTWTGYSITAKGRGVLRSGPIILPVPASIREYEREQAAKVQQSLEYLKKAGADVTTIPQHELEEGDGTVFKALTTWHSYLDRLERNGNSDRMDQLEDLRLRIDGWRLDVAEKYRIAPADAMPEHSLLSVAYATASSGVTEIEKSVLIAAGVRSGGIDSLVETLNEWKRETTPKTSDQAGKDDLSVMTFSEAAYTPRQCWEHFIYRPQKKTGLASWESSYQRFTNGEHPQTIAMSPINGRPIQVNTVIGHIFEGLLSGRPVNLRRLSTLGVPPTKAQWEILRLIENETGFDVTEDPKISGVDGGSFKMSDFLASIMGDEFVNKDYADRTPNEKAKFGKWCELLKWYTTLRRIQYAPIFKDSSEKDEQITDSAEKDGVYVIEDSEENEVHANI